jgi:ariadne-1
MDRSPISKKRRRHSKFLSSNSQMELCLSVLSHTYNSLTHSFYLDKSNQTEIFEQNQADLEFATENLSELCEKPVEIIQEQNLKQVILDKSVYVKSRQDVLLQDTARGLAEGRWGFNIHAKS